MEENQQVATPEQEMRQAVERQAYTAHVQVAQALATCSPQIVFTILASLLASLHVQFGIDDAKMIEVRQFMELAYTEKLKEIREIPEYEQSLAMGFCPIGIPPTTFQPQMTFVIPVPTDLVDETVNNDPTIN